MSYLIFSSRLGKHWSLPIVSSDIKFPSALPNRVADLSSKHQLLMYNLFLRGPLGFMSMVSANGYRSIHLYFPPDKANVFISCSFKKMAHTISLHMLPSAHSSLTNHILLFQTINKSGFPSTGHLPTSSFGHTEALSNVFFKWLLLQTQPFYQSLPGTAGYGQTYPPSIQPRRTSQYFPWPGILPSLLPCTTSVLWPDTTSWQLSYYTWPKI